MKIYRITKFFWKSQAEQYTVSFEAQNSIHLGHLTRDGITVRTNGDQCPTFSISMLHIFIDIEINLVLPFAQ